MRRIVSVLGLVAGSGWLCGCATPGRPTPAAAETPAGPVATGFVFDDANGNGVRDAGEKGLARMRVSNGRDVVLTDGHGAYRLPIDDDTILFVIKPRGWMTPVDPFNQPRFYYIHKPQGTPALNYPGVAPTGPLPASVDFALRRQAEPDRFQVLLFGDTQTASIEDVNDFAHDIVEPASGTPAGLGISLGDLVHEKPALRAPLSGAIAQLGIPWYNVLGNHDMDYAAPDDQHSDANFERTYGPAYYSFDYGPVHFIVLDDVIWHGATAEKKGHYTAGLGAAQLEFLRNDLELVPREQLVVLTMHIPMVQIAERKELYALLAEHPHTVSFSGHTHDYRHWFIDARDGWPGATPHHHTTVGATCGSWWNGALDEVGIPHATMADGVPNNWCMVTFAGHDHAVEYRAARRPADYQMNIYAPDAVPAAQAGQTEVLVNVFAGSERSTVEMRCADGAWTPLERVEREDPYYVELKESEKATPPPKGRKLPKPDKTKHIWRGVLPAGLSAGTHLIEVRTTDVYGQTYLGRRIIRLE
ncbi:MAG TPA: calcineurin-like phosphoesterase family protein [Phycisphaerae bacterium]|nr:calcineurin-like phosphoesterase family protein [Phycisphaerae bacterium]